MRKDSVFVMQYDKHEEIRLRKEVVGVACFARIIRGCIWRLDGDIFCYSLIKHLV